MQIMIKAPRKLASKSSLCLAFGAIVLAGCAASAPASGVPEVNFEGLTTVAARRLDVAQVRSGVDFSTYSGLLVSAPELAFRTPDRSNLEFALADVQKQRFQTMLATAFTAEFAALNNLQLSDVAGPEVIELLVRVQDIVATVPPSTVGGIGRGGMALQAVGNVTLVLELSDSLSNEILARGVDTRKVEGVAMRQSGNRMLTRWEDIAELCAEWASIARSGLEDLTARR